ncbi:MAG TPA: hypothetical protein VLE22_24280 [Bryobacteraceae bacterium]|nr:hypothetical protein [Bryobacteraceae bacterium]
MSASERRSKESTGLIVAVVMLLLAPLVVYVAMTSGDQPEVRDESPVRPTSLEQPAPRARVVTSTDLDREERLKNRKQVSKPAIPAPAPPVKRQRKAFPTPEAIPVGTRKSQLIATFGTPSMITTAVDEGRATETFVYLQRDVEMGTVVHLRSGVVVGTGSTPY